MREPAGVVARTSMQERYPVIFGANGLPVSVITPDGTYPFPAGEPMEPALKPGTPPRALVPPPFGNVMARPRVFSGAKLTPFEQLRALAEFDLVQIALQDCRGQILGMEWEVGVRKEFAKQNVQTEIDAARAWLDMPDPLADVDFDTWLGKIIEEIYVTDALTLAPRMTRAGKPIGLEQIDGATIAVLLDDRGKPALPPNPAFQQVAHGRAETEFLLGEIWYLPRNARPNVPYGRSNVEQVLWTVNLALRRYLDDLSYYTSGNLPDALFAAPAAWNQNQIEEYQAYFDALLEGRTDKRAGALKFVPGGEGAALHILKTRDWAPEFNEWLARVICYAFQVSPLPLVRLMNRGTAETSEQAGIEGGVRPVAQFIASFINRYLKRCLALTKVQFRWLEDEVEDADVVARRNVAYTHGGGQTFNEWREAIGGDPYEGEWAKRPMLVTQAGQVIFLDTIEEDLKRKEEQADLMAALLAAGGAPGSGEGGEEPADDAEEEDAPPPPTEKLFQAELQRRAVALREDLLKWRRMALKRAKEGKPQRRFESTAIPAHVRERIEKALGVTA
jgi:hypothetical protein